MRVALVCGSYDRDRDGVADYVGMLAAALPGSGVNPLILSAADPLILSGAGDRPSLSGAGDRPAAVGSPGRGQPPVVSFARPWDLRGAVAAVRALARLRPDVVHVQFAPSAYRFSPAVGLLPLLLGAAGPRVPVITTVHEYGWWAWPGKVPAAAWRPLERRGWWDRETGALGVRSAELIATTPGAARVVRERIGRSARVVPIGPNVTDAGWDRQTVRRQVRAELGLPAATTLLAFFGFVHPVKGVRYLLEALAALRQDRPDLHLVVAGGFTSLALPGEEALSFRRELDKHAAAAGVADATTFLGHRPAREVSRVLAGTDVGVLPFTAGVTTKSGALLALWAHRLPVVVTDVASAAERDPEIVDGHSAVVVPGRRDTPALVAGIRRLLDDPALQARVAAGGSRRVAGRSWERVGAAHAELYRQVLGQLVGR